MTPSRFAIAAPEQTLDALLLPLVSGELPQPPDGRALFLRARDGAGLRAIAQAGWLYEQSFKPFADALSRSGLQVGTAGEDEHFGLVLLLPPRQRDEARALFARAVLQAMPGGRVLACVPNAEGARSAAADLAQLGGCGGQLSKHKCRTFWTPPLLAVQDRQLLQDWLALDTPRANAAGYISRPGLFAWDRIDAASALLATQLPADLHGRVADLGAGYGYLATQVLAHCPRVSVLDLYEAEARALEPARLNLAEALRDSGREIAVAVHWHDVAAGLPHRYDAIVSNPPFHQGRADLPELGRAFITQAAAALQPHGRLFMVANRHLPYEATLTAHFHEVRMLALQDGFKVIEAAGVRA